MSDNSSGRMDRQCASKKVLKNPNQDGHFKLWKALLKVLWFNINQEITKKEEQSGDSLWNVYCCASVHTKGFIISAVSIETAHPLKY